MLGENQEMTLAFQMNSIIGGQTLYYNGFIFSFKDIVIAYYMNYQTMNSVLKFLHVY